MSVVIVKLHRITKMSHRGVAQFGSALDLGSRGREFESLHPDQYLYDLGV